MLFQSFASHISTLKKPKIYQPASYKNKKMLKQQDPWARIDNCSLQEEKHFYSTQDASGEHKGLRQIVEEWFA